MPSFHRHITQWWEKLCQRDAGEDMWITDLFMEHPGCRGMWDIRPCSMPERRRADYKTRDPSWISDVNCCRHSTNHTARVCGNIGRRRNLGCQRVRQLAPNNLLPIEMENPVYIATFNKASSKLVRRPSLGLRAVLAGSVLYPSSQTFIRSRPGGRQANRAVQSNGLFAGFQGILYIPNGGRD